MSFTAGALLGGRIRYAQPETGYRTGIEPVVLAACVPARAGERVLEAGTGAGAGLLCLAARVPGVQGLGLERDAGQAALARANAEANGFAALAVEQADLLAWRAETVFDHAFANPPWHDAAGTASPDAMRRGSKQAPAGGLAAWVDVLAGAVRRRGTVTVILPAARFGEGAAALAGAGCAEMRLLPLWPRAGAEAKIIVLQGVAGGRGACSVLPGLVLHDAGQAYTGAADAVLRGGRGLDLSGAAPGA